MSSEDPATIPVRIRRRTTAEALTHVARDLREHPGKYDALTVSILLDTLAAQADETVAFSWGESVTRSDDRILVHLNRGGETVADLDVDAAEARLLADMLHDAAGPEPCPNRGPSGFGPLCTLDAREHYHYVTHPSGREVVIEYGSERDKAAYPPDGYLRGRPYR